MSFDSVFGMRINKLQQSKNKRNDVETLFKLIRNDWVDHVELQQQAAAHRH